MPFELPRLPGSSLPKLPSFLRSGKEVVPGLPYTAPNMALPVEGSKFEKVLKFINRLGTASDAAKVELIKGHGVSKAAKAYWRGVKGKDETTGSDVIRALRGAKKPPKTKLGRLAEGAAGLALNIFDPTNPINWVGVGQLSKAGRVAMKVLPKAPRMAEGMIAGQRALGSIHVPFIGAVAETPQWMNKLGGTALLGAKSTAMAVPGMKQAARIFKKPFDKLTSIEAARKVREGRIITEHQKLIEAPYLKKKIIEPAILKIKSGELAAVNPKAAAHYKNVGYSPSQILTAEVRRLHEAPIIEKQKAGVHPHEADFDKAYSAGIEGETLPEIRYVADALGESFEKLGKLKEHMGTDKYLEAFTARPGSGEFKQALRDLEIENKGGARVLKMFTTEQIEQIGRDPEMRSKMYEKILGTGELKKNPQLLAKLRLKDPEATTLYDSDLARSYAKHLQASAKEVSTAEAVKDIVQNQSFARPSLADWAGEKGIVKVEVPDKFQKWAGAKETWMPSEIVPEFKRVAGIITDQNEMNTMIRAFDNVQNWWKRWTLFSPPGSIPTVARNLLSNRVMSYLAGALSPAGERDAFSLVMAMRRAGDNPVKLEQEIKALGPLGQHLKILADQGIFSEGMTTQELVSTGNKFEKLMGVELGMKANQTVEASSRAQHYMTRIHQGWNPEAALADTRKWQYDYTNFSNEEKQVFKRIFPFYSWSRNNIPAIIEHVLTKPGKMSLTENVKKNIENSLGVSAEGGKPDESTLSEFVKGDLHIRLVMDPKTGKWTYLRLKNMLPQADIEDLMGTGRMRDLGLSALSPMIKAPIEAVTNKSLFFKQPGGGQADIERYPGEPGEFLGMNIPKGEINLLRNIRMLNEINRLMPSKTGKPKLTIPEQAVRYSGLSVVPVDPARDMQDATWAFKRSWDQYRDSVSKAKKRYDQPKIESGTEQLRKLLRVGVPGEKKIK